MKSIRIGNNQPLGYGAQEALNRLRVAVDLSGKQFKIIMITSSTPEEGKSFVSTNLWKMLAESGKRVVLIDGDLRRTQLRSRLQISGASRRSIGLVHYLAGNVELEDAVYSTDIPNAFMVPVFETISNPIILLQNPRFDQMLEILKQNFDYVLIDTPPLGSVADGELIATKCDGAILVCRGGVTPKKLIGSSLKQLERAECTILGTVLNRVHMTRSSGYYYKYSKYGYYYDYYYTSDGDKKKKRGHHSRGASSSSKDVAKAPETEQDGASAEARQPESGE